MIGSGAEPSGNRRAVQAAAPARRLCAARALASAAAALSALLLWGCAEAPPALNPVDWYHNVEGGEIAAKRPPIPGATAPYPNLANVPHAPSVLGAAERDRISAQLLAERTHAQQEAALAPVAPASGGAGGQAAPASAPAPAPAPASTPASAGAAASAPASAGPAHAAGAAAESPAPPQPPAQSPESQSPESQSAQSQSTQSQSSESTSAALAAAAATLPPVPAAPPPPPAIAGFATPGPPPDSFGLSGSAALTLYFPAGSSALSAAERARLQSLATRRGKANIAVVGYGDATESSAAAQSEALHLGLARASAVADALTAFGVPPGALRLGAEASGGGATLRLLPLIPPPAPAGT
ncbi:MAG TPA: OmpA family protein [Acetobacteraceae bacterium]|nr:OmpA family protein [Acetobacteraceae bacterium]